MKIRRVELHNFKRFDRYVLDLTDPITGLARDIVVLVGQNGVGKSSLLQAIAACLGTATKRLARPSDLDWPGFDLSLAGEAWDKNPTVTIEVEFSSDELSATVDLYERLQATTDQPLTRPSQGQCVTLTMQGDAVKALSPSQYFQFRGRSYARQLVSAGGRDFFQRVGWVYWYNEHRTTSSLTLPEFDESHRVKHEDAITMLRRRLGEWQAFHDRVVRGEFVLRPGQRDFYELIESAYRRVFPDRHFVGTVPRMEIGTAWDEPYFLLNDGQKDYELDEMSAGERSVFPILFDFVNWSIHRSVVLVDELELHLQPSQQQSVLRALNRIGMENQFIITTHSDAITDIMPSEAIVRIDEANPGQEHHDHLDTEGD